MSPRRCLLILAFAGLTYLTKGETPTTESQEAPYQQLERFARTLEIIREQYVDKDKISYDQLFDSALHGVLNSLDPHSQYLNNSELIEFSQNQENSYQLLGLTVGIENNQLTVVTVNEEGSSAEKGILPGDIILKIEDTFTSKLGIVSSLKKLSGKIGTSKKLTLFRPSDHSTYNAEPSFRPITHETVKDPTILPKSLTGDQTIAYIRLTEFDKDCSKRISKELDRLELETKPQALILDLRNNPGGYITEAAAIVGEFIPENEIIITTKGRSPDQPPPYRTPKRGSTHRTYPLAVLINQSSASASELVSKSLQDLNRALIVGRTSFGKGSVQSLINIEENIALRLTTAHYFTSSKSPIHLKGVTPDIICDITPKEENRIFKAWRTPSLANDTAHKISQIGDLQLQRAIDALAGVIIFKNKSQPWEKEETKTDTSQN